MNPLFKSLIITSVAVPLATAGEYNLSSMQDPVEPMESLLWTSSRPDGHAPIGVMGDHVHEGGEWMLSFRYGFMHMDTNRVGDSSIADRKIISPKGEGFMVTPTEMDMHMYMPGVMYAPTDKLTLMFMAPYAYKSMDHLRRDGATFTTESEGFGDLKLTSLVEVFNANRQAAHLGLGVGFPTGSTDEEDFIPGPGVTQLPYPMQLGSGTWDLLPSVTYLGQADRFSWGTQAGGVIRLDENDHGYTLGDQFNATVWGAAMLSDKLSFSTRVSYLNWGNIDGSDKDLKIPATAVPTADPDLRGGQRLDLAFGLNYYFNSGALSGNRLAVELGFPLWEDLDGPQLGRDFFLTAGWQWAF